MDGTENKELAIIEDKSKGKLRLLLNQLGNITQFGEDGTYLVVVKTSANWTLVNSVKQAAEKERKAILDDPDGIVPLVKKADELHNELVRKRDDMLKPYDTLKAACLAANNIYIREQNRLKEIEEARLREVARKQEEDRRLAEALELEAEGRKEEAQAVIEEPMTIVAPTVKADMPKYDARQYRAPIPKARVIDKAKFVIWCTLSPDRLGYLLVDERALNQKAKSLGKAIITSIPGILYYEE